MKMSKKNIYCICDKIYNLTDFVDKHPGGTDMFNNLNDHVDITPLIYSYHKDPEILFEILSKYEILNDNSVIKYKTNYKYEKYVELKNLVYAEIRAKNMPLYWSNFEIAYNVGIFAFYIRIWIYCAQLACSVSSWWFVLLAIINIGHCALVFHETSHYTGFKNQHMNAIMSKIAVAPILTVEEWKWDHNYLHHCFTNTVFDSDFNGHNLTFRHSVNHPHYIQHQFQHFYAAALFCVGGFTGQIDAIKYKRCNFVIFVLIVYCFGFFNTFVFYGLSGFLFLSIAQLSHIQPECILESSDDFLTNQVSSSMNYKTDNLVARLICFGLDIQIEQHLFPNIPHSTLRQIQPIVREYCLKNGISYIEKPNVFEMVKSYFQHLREMGKRPIANI
jgi:linoleoyl-CoA desaturase